MIKGDVNDLVSFDRRNVGYQSNLCVYSVSDGIKQT